MRWAVAAACVAGVGFGLPATACGADPGLPPLDAGSDRLGHVDPDSPIDPPDAGPRLLPHDGVILQNIQLGVIYVDDVDAGGAPGMDGILEWLVSSPYWALLEEYGVGGGTLVGGVRIPTSALLHPGDVDGTTGLVEMLVLDARIAALLHGDPDAGTGPTVTIPGANAYALYLPDDLNVALGHRGSYTYQTCIDANGYHAFDGYEPYAVLPPCDAGRSLYAAAHELSEVATDPQPYHGWVSDVDIASNGGEVADLCAKQVMQEGVIVTQLWSNAQARCVP